MGSSVHWEKHTSVCREAAQARAQGNEEEGAGGQGPSRAARSPDLPYTLLGAKVEKRPQVDRNLTGDALGSVPFPSLRYGTTAADLGHQPLQKAQDGASSRQDARLASSL